MIGLKRFRWAWIACLSVTLVGVSKPSNRGLGVARYLNLSPLALITGSRRRSASTAIVRI